MEKIADVFQYAKDRDALIKYILDLTKELYGDDLDMVNGICGLTNTLHIAEADPQFVAGMLGFINYAESGELSREITKSSILTTLVHDIGEFSRNRHEPWFLPLTAGYVKFAEGKAAN